MPDFGKELIEAVKRSSEKLKNASTDEAIEFLKRAGILTKFGNIKKKFKGK